MIEVNGRSYHAPRCKTVLICLDGSDPEYLEDVLGAGCAPTLAGWRANGTWLTGRSVIPSFTNPNNASIVCGVPPSVHGISGNHFFDMSEGIEIPMTSRRHLRTDTILERFSAAGTRVLSGTAKEKLLEIVSPGPSGLSFSAEAAGGLGVGSAVDLAGELVGPRPTTVYSAAASLYVLDAGVAAVKRDLADLIYLSTTDYVQHKHPPGSHEARAFYAEVDRRLSEFDALGAIVGLTADHGMQDKTNADGSPNVIYLSPILDAVTARGARVLLPITDPYVVHHGALGSCATVYLPDGDPRAAKERLMATPGIELVLDREEAVLEFDLPGDRIGDLLVLSAKGAVLGKRPEDHDLSSVKTGLRSHGGLYERMVPIVLNRRLAPDHALNYTLSKEGLRNFDLFDLALNGLWT